MLRGELRIGTQRDPSLCNAKCGEETERDGAEPAANDYVSSDGPVDCERDVALGNGHRHHAVIAMRQRSKDRICSECEQAAVDTDLPCGVFAQVQYEEAGVR